MVNLLSRRDVIKTFVVTTASSIIGNKVWAAKAIGEVAAIPDPTDVGQARILLSNPNFAALNFNNGSIRLGSSGISDDFPIGLYYPIIINRISATEYVALKSECAHASCVVGSFSGGSMTCPCHGSTYNIRGQRTGGEANANLISYPTRLANGVLFITLQEPAIGFSIDFARATGAAGERIALTFSSFSGVEYEVRRRANPTAEPTPVPFATTVGGTIPQTPNFLTGNDFDRTVYVAPQDGIFQVCVRLRAV